MNFQFEQTQQFYEEMKHDMDSMSVSDFKRKYFSKNGSIKVLMAEFRNIPNEAKPQFGKEVNEIKQIATNFMKQQSDVDSVKLPIDLTAPFHNNTSVAQRPKALASLGHKNPLSRELERILDIFTWMGFDIEECRQLDDDYHMFESLNFPQGHPARDNWDTFWTEEHLIPPAHTSTMQNRVLQKYDIPIRVVVPGTVFRNEATDASHEHTLFQVEGVYVDKGVSFGHMLAVIKTYLEAFFEKKLDIKTQPAFFPFTEPDLEFMISCPFCDAKGCNVCGNTGWIEAMGCGMIHPNVLREANIDPEVYSGFAWGFGLDRLIMIKNSIHDVRLLRSGNLDFLTQF